MLRHYSRGVTHSIPESRTDAKNLHRRNRTLAMRRNLRPKQERSADVRFSSRGPCAGRRNASTHDPPDIGVQLDSGPPELKPGAILQCATSLREHDAIVETKIPKVSDLMLDCGDHRFVVKTIDFSPRK
jgi:hypothetical protein